MNFNNNLPPKYTQREDFSSESKIFNCQNGNLKKDYQSNGDNDDDLLPSFDLHNFILNRPLNERVTPEYQESVQTTFSSHHTQTDFVFSNEFGFNSSNNVVNNLHKLQKLNLPIDIKVILTEEFPFPLQKYETRNPLKCYKPDDMVYGFVTFENKSDVVIPFEMLLVSLECEIGVISSKNNNPIQKKLITMYDLEASFNYLISKKDGYLTLLFDPIDNTYIGFLTRNLEPGIVIKKLFKFKIPSYLLDDTCENQFTEHLKVPPSFGIDVFNYPMIRPNYSVGYSSMDKSGSPFNVNDYALYGEFCQYFINIQIIGKQLDKYRKYYKENTKEPFEFIFLKNTKHHFRVITNPEYNMEAMHQNSTKEQLQMIETLVIEAIDVLKERQMLVNVGIVDVLQQDEIIFSSSGKSKQPILFPRSDEYKIKGQAEIYLKSETKFEFKKEFLSKIDGNLTIVSKMKKDSTIISFLPKLMETRKINIYNSQSYLKSTTPAVSLELSFSMNGKSNKFPSVLHIEPILKAIDIESPYPIPFTIDQQFIVQDSKTIEKLFNKYKSFNDQIKSLVTLTGFGIPKTTGELMRGMEYLRYQEIIVPKILKTHTIDLTQKTWLFDELTSNYKLNLEIPLEYDILNIETNPKALVPSIQTCYFSRLYKIDMCISPNKWKKGNKSIFPVMVI